MKAIFKMIVISIAMLVSVNAFAWTSADCSNPAIMKQVVRNITNAVKNGSGFREATKYDFGAMKAFAFPNGRLDRCQVGIIATTDVGQLSSNFAYEWRIDSSGHIIETITAEAIVAKENFRYNRFKNATPEEREDLEGKDAMMRLIGGM